MVDCLLIVVAYRSVRDVAGLLETVPAAVGDLTWHAVVVNNEPTDDLGPVVSNYPNAQLVESGGNIGYAGGINVGLAAAPASTWTVFLNPDLRLGPGSIARLTGAGKHVAAVPTIVDNDGVRQCSLRTEPSILGSLGDALLGDSWPQRPAVLSEMIRDARAYHRSSAIDWATGAALSVPTTLVSRVGSWDSERFFLYSEETDYCRRLRTLGAQIRFVPDAVVHHRGAGSGTSDALYVLQELNRIRYFRKWHGTIATGAYAGVVGLNSLFRAHRARNRSTIRALFSVHARAVLPGGTR